MSRITTKVYTSVQVPDLESLVGMYHNPRVSIVAPESVENMVHQAKLRKFKSNFQAQAIVASFDVVVIKRDIIDWCQQNQCTPANILELYAWVVGLQTTVDQPAVYGLDSSEILREYIAYPYVTQLGGLIQIGAGFLGKQGFVRFERGLRFLMIRQ